MARALIPAAKTNFKISWQACLQLKSICRVQKRCVFIALFEIDAHQVLGVLHAQETGPTLRFKDEAAMGVFLMDKAPPRWL